MDEQEKKRRIKEKLEKQEGRDPFDGIMGWAQASEDFVARSGGDVPRAYSDYPEHLTEALRAFVEVFQIPTKMIPFGKQQDYGKWVSGLEEINQICEGEKMIRPAMEIAHARFSERPYHLTHPKAITKYLGGAVVALKSRPSLTSPNQKDVVPADKAALLKRLKNRKISRGGGE